MKRYSGGIHMTQEVRKKLGEPKNDLERDTLNYIEPLITEI